MHEPSPSGGEPSSDVSTWEPAITPTLDGSEGTVPTFTADDARNWVLAHPPRVRRSLEVFEVGSVWFGTAAEADRRILPMVTGLVPDALVCVVTLYGHIEMPGVRTGVIAAPYRHVQEVFDATTGTILVLRAPGPPVGREAITARLHPGHPIPPVFSVEDVCTYVLVNWHRIETEFTKLRGVGGSSVMGVQFLPSAQANQVLDTTLGLAPDALVCVVELHGRFQENLTFHAPLSSVRVPQRSTGGPAITPTRDSVPSFTEQDVRDYFSSRERPGAVNQPTITQIVFTTCGELDTARGGGNQFSANYGADTPICYVELSGTFHDHGPPTRERSVKTYDTSYRVFDARTGNFLLMGMPARAKWS